ISAFRKNPKDLDPVKWKRVQKRAATEKTELLDIIQEEYNMTVAPAFSDHVNDPQPAWTDVTFFRMYMDHPKEAKQFHDRDYEPYILFDVIKSNLYHGEIRNEGLWDTLSDIIPYYQNHFGIDGARIDMGHALPEELVALIIEKARKKDPDFCFIAEQMYPEKAESSRQAGYNMIIGNGFMKEPRIWDHQTHSFFYDTRHLPCPMFACGETHDTPRLAARDGGRNLSKMLTVLNLFMPNGVPFINSGQEVYELQPMNTGLDCRPNEAYVLDSKDPYYGKLALFDKYVLHYLNPNRWDLPDALELLTAFRSAHIDTFTKLENLVPLGFNSPTDPGIAFGFIDNDKRSEKHSDNNIFIIAANTDVYNSQHLTVHLHAIREVSGNLARHGVMLYSTHSMPRDIYEFDYNWNLSMRFEPGEVKIIRM
ncbi:MAG: alpha-amylase, partial [Clostridia bacterium]|nr:alpha-amylase [Clostridia bacterium]